MAHVQPTGPSLLRLLQSLRPPPHDYRYMGCVAEDSGSCAVWHPLGQGRWGRFDSASLRQTLMCSASFLFWSRGDTSHRSALKRKRSK